VLALEALDAAGFRGETEVVTTSANPLLEKLAIHVALRPKTRLTVDCEDLAAFFARHDLQIGAGGGATWERCRLGAPTVALILASNQEPVLQALVGQGVLTALPPGRTSVEQLAREITLLLGDFDLRQRYSERSARLVDGGGATRVARELLL
jgi:spore coat polysaccharide biosynthesis predicted glycosyltransferase SpsG